MKALLPLLAAEESKSNAKNKISWYLEWNSPPQVKIYRLTFLSKNEGSRAEEKRVWKSGPIKANSTFWLFWSIKINFMEKNQGNLGENQHMEKKPWKKKSVKSYEETRNSKLSWVHITKVSEPSGFQCRNGLKSFFNPVLPKKNDWDAETI